MKNPFSTKLVCILNKDGMTLTQHIESERCNSFQEDGHMSLNQRTNGPVNAHLISWPCKAQNIQNLENIW